MCSRATEEAGALERARQRGAAGKAALHLLPRGTRGIKSVSSFGNPGLQTHFIQVLKVKVIQPCPTLRPHGLYSPWNSPGQETAVGSLCLLQVIFPTPGANPCLPHRRGILFQLSHKAYINIYIHKHILYIYFICINYLHIYVIFLCIIILVTTSVRSKILQKRKLKPEVQRPPRVTQLVGGAPGWSDCRVLLFSTCLTSPLGRLHERRGRKAPAPG